MAKLKGDKLVITSDRFGPMVSVFSRMFYGVLSLRRSAFHKNNGFLFRSLSLEVKLKEGKPFLYAVSTKEAEKNSSYETKEIALFTDLEDAVEYFKHQQRGWEKI